MDVDCAGCLIVEIELPPIPPQPAASAPAADWVRYLDILRLHVSAESAAAVDRQTAQMALMTAAAVRSGDLMQQLLDQTPPPSPAPAGSDAARVVVSALMAENTDRPPAEVATAVLARVAAVDSMLGGESA